jgi:hypothetical protein
MRRVAIFKWNEPLPESDEDDPERLTLLAAQPAAQAMLAALIDRGYASSDETLGDEEGGWHFHFTLPNQRYFVLVMWTGIGEPDEDYFAVQFHIPRGCLGLLLPRLPDSAVEPACRAVDEILRSLSPVTHLQWVTDQEFRAAYCDGDPLPNARGL